MVGRLAGIFLPRIQPEGVKAISIAPLTDLGLQKCIAPECGQTFGVEEVHVGCPTCGSLLDIVYQWDRVPLPGRRNRDRP